MALTKRFGVLFIVTIVAVAALVAGGCRQAPSQKGLAVTRLEISGYGIVEVPEGVEVLHRNLLQPSEDIAITFTFNKELDPNNSCEILLFSGGSAVVAYPSVATPKQKYFYYRIEGKTLSLHHVAGSSLPNFLVTVVLPAELRAVDGSRLQNDNFVWLSTSWPSPQALVTQAEGLDKPLRLPVWGRNDGRDIAYLLEDTPLYRTPSRAGEALGELGTGENVRVLAMQGEWAEVMVYYPKHLAKDTALDRLAGGLDVWTSDLVRRVQGHVPRSVLQAIPRPRNTSSFVTVDYFYIGHDIEVRRIGVTMHILPAGGVGASLLPGEILTQERLDLLEADALKIFGHWTAGRSWLQAYSRGGVGGFLSLHDPYIHHPFHAWTPAQHSRYLAIRRAYVDRLEQFWDAYAVAPAYSSWKERFREGFRREVKMQDIWVAWSAEDKNLRIETLARKLADAFGQTTAEKAAILAQITQEESLDENQGWQEFLATHVNLQRDFAHEIQARRRALFRE
ncbi:MAG: hypothetical protein KGZ66_08985 [Selenomonadales bacterium]|nr:hypothetical protein [Selenomonadales bacterium]